MKNILAISLLGIACWANSACAAGKASTDTSAAQGKQVFAKWCSVCHAPGERMPGTASLAVKYGGLQPAALEERKDLALDFIKHFVRKGVLIMPPFRKTEITDAELEALAAYLSHQKEKDQ